MSVPGGASTDIKGKEIDVLIKEYEARSKEIDEATQRYHRQGNLVQLYFSAIIGIAGLATANKDSRSPLLGLPEGEASTLVFLLLVLAALIGTYLFATTMDALFMLTLNGERRAALEHKLNERMATSDLLVWDSRIIPHAFSVWFGGIKFWIKPNVLVACLSFIALTLTYTMLGFVCRFVNEAFFPYFGVGLVALFLFHLHQFLAYFFVGIPALAGIVEHHSGIPSGELHPTTETGTARADRGDQSGVQLNVTRRDVTIGLLTLCAGPVPMAMLAAWSGTFWPTSTHPFGFVYSTSLTLGDFILLPALNAVLARLAVSWWERTQPPRWLLAAGIFALLAASLPLSWGVHISWTRDAYLGFMDVVPGQLTLAGVWHAAFSALQGAAIAAFWVLWVAEFWTRGPEMATAARGAILLAGFAGLGLVDAALAWGVVGASTAAGTFLRERVPNFLQAAVVIGAAVWSSRRMRGT